MRAGIRHLVACVSLVVLAGCAAAHSDGAADQAVTVPAADHHTHLFTAAAIARLYRPPLPAVAVPPELARLLSERTRRWDDPAAIAELYAEDSVVFDFRGPRWIRGRGEVAKYIGGLFMQAYHITPVILDIAGSRGHLVGYYATGEGSEQRPFGHVSLALQQG
ncbi:MAG TPA: hypothetical protein VGB85_19405, partial [Nannocystis sp.]